MSMAAGANAAGNEVRLFIGCRFTYVLPCTCTIDSGLMSVVVGGEPSFIVVAVTLYAIVVAVEE